MHETSLDAPASRRLGAYIHQARQYYDIIAGLDPATKPLPAYYFALNLTKAYLTLVDPSVTKTTMRHGLSAKTQPRQRYRFSQEYSQVESKGVFRELALRTGQGFCWQPGVKVQISRLAAYLVEGVDLYSDAVGRSPKLIPVAATGVLASQPNGNDGGRAWLTVDVSRMALKERGLAARSLLSQAGIFASRFRLVHDPEDSATYTYESINPLNFSRTTMVLDGLRREFDKSLILRNRTAQGGLDYLVRSPRNELLSMESVTFVLLHHLSNMVRYRPEHVESLRGDKYWWLFTSWVDRACENFLLSLASRISLEEHLIL